MPRFQTICRLNCIGLILLALIGCSDREILTGIPESLQASAWNGTMQTANESDELVEINLGDVGAEQTFTAWFKLENDGQRPIELREANYDMDNQTGDRWEMLEWLPAGDWNNRTQLTLPQTLAPQQSLILGVPFHALAEGDAFTDLRILAGAQTQKLLRVKARGVSSGDPDISVSFGDAPGTTIETTCIQGVCSTPDNTPVVLGSFDAQTEITIPMTIRNTAQCTV